MEKVLKFNVGGMWDYKEWEIYLNCNIRAFSGTEKCSHCRDDYMETKKRFDGSTFNVKHFVCPRVVVAVNEGGHNTTGVCLDCILEAVKTL